MIHIQSPAWHEMVAHAEADYPEECCGAMLGVADANGKQVLAALRLENAHPGSRRARYELRPEDLLRSEREARARGLQLIGIYHSHPDADAYFSETDLKNSCPWYSFVVLSVKSGRFVHANCWLPDRDQTRAEPEALSYAQSSHPHGA
jgi:proteasome lid subunit RPN8/RPN11